MGNLVRDIRCALRTLRWNRGFSFAGITALALGIGAGNAVFSVENALLLDSGKLTLFERALEKIRATPGVPSAGTNALLPLTGLLGWTGFTMDDRPAPAKGREPVTNVSVIDPNYFNAMCVPLLKGRMSTVNDNAAAPPVYIVNESFARANCPYGNILGRHSRVAMKDNVPGGIVGVAGGAHHQALDKAARQTVCYAHPRLAFGFVTFVIRTNLPPRLILYNMLLGARWGRHLVCARPPGRALVPVVNSSEGHYTSLPPAIRLTPAPAAIHSVDPEQPIGTLAQTEEVLAEPISRSRFTMLLAIFASLAITLAAVGVYLVTSYSVIQRTKEIGLRMALGAERCEVLRLIASGSLPRIVQCLFSHPNDRESALRFKLRGPGHVPRRCFSATRGRTRRNINSSPSRDEGRSHGGSPI